MERIYLAHSISDYETDYEKEMFKSIRERFGDECDYINPGSPEIEKEFKKYISFYSLGYDRFKVEMDFFYNKIKKCVMLIAIPESKTGRFTGGVKGEIICAMKIGIDIRKLIVNDNIVLDMLSKDDILQLNKWKEKDDNIWNILDREPYEETEIE